MADAPTQIGDYEIEGELGAGGMATVYKARHTLLDTHHAVKVLDPELRSNADARQRFLDEARIQAKHLDHVNIVKVTNIVATPEHAALVMELIEGPSLEAEAGKLAGRPDEIRRIMAGVLDGVGYAHAAGIIHRDLKPANVLLASKPAPRTPKVSDFGIAKVTAESGKSRKKSTHAAARMGTLSYMSPEQIKRAKDVTARSDIFSLGAVLYELATGTLAFDGETDYDVMEQIVHGRYTPPEERNRKIDPVIAQVIRRALEPDPDKRYASCAEMAAALRGDGAAAVGAAPGDAAASSARADLDEKFASWQDKAPRTGRGVKLVAAAGSVLALAGVAAYVSLRAGASTGAHRGSATTGSAKETLRQRIERANPFVEDHGVRIQAHQVSRLEYVWFLASLPSSDAMTAMQPVDPAWNPNGPEPESPISWVTFERALGFCKVIDASLPTDAQWLAVAHGGWGLDPGKTGIVGPLEEWTSQVVDGLATVRGAHAGMTADDVELAIESPMLKATETLAGAGAPAATVASAMIGFRCVR